MNEFKPGDVAMVTNKHGVDNVAICSLSLSSDGYVWKFGVADSMEQVDGSTARLLLVIDPEDRRQFLSLGQAYCDANDGVAMIPEFVAGRIKAAVTHLLNLPTEPEPTGLGAVIEDRKGNKWLRCFGDPGFHVWRRQVGFDNSRYKWSELDVVRVLSEGLADD